MLHHLKGPPSRRQAVSSLTHPSAAVARLHQGCVALAQEQRSKGRDSSSRYGTLPVHVEAYDRIEVSGRSQTRPSDARTASAVWDPHQIRSELLCVEMFVLVAQVQFLRLKCNKEAHGVTTPETCSPV
jgi:hypothetical protein